MDIAVAFATLGEIEDKISGILPIDDTAKLNSLDERYEELWREILSHAPSDYQTAETMAIYLLDKLADRAEAGENTTMLREKILELFQIIGMGQPKQGSNTENAMPCRRLI